MQAWHILDELIDLERKLTYAERHLHMALGEQGNADDLRRALAQAEEGRKQAGDLVVRVAAAGRAAADGPVFCLN